MNYLMTNNPRKHPVESVRNSSLGFSLIEVTLAVGVAGFCLLTLFGLLPVGLSSNQTSLEQTTAGNIAGAIVADLRSAQPMGAGTSPRFLIPIPAPPTSPGSTQTSGTTIYLSTNGGGNGTGTVVLGGTNGSRYRATIGFYYPSSGQYSPTSRTATAVRILITWPALADSSPGVWSFGSSPSWPVNYTGSCEVDTTLDRN